MVGDSILTVDGKAIKSAEMLSETINECGGREIKIELERKGQTLKKLVKPVRALRKTSIR